MPYPLRIILTWLRHIARRAVRSLVGRLVLALLGLFLVLAGLQVRDHYARVRSQRGLVDEIYRKDGSAAASLLRANLAHLHRSHRTILQALLAGRVPGDQVVGFLRDHQDQWRGAAGVQVAGMDGKVRSSTAALGYDNDLSDEPYFATLTPRTPLLLSNVVTPEVGEVPRFRVVSLITGQTLDTSANAPDPALLSGSAADPHERVVGYVVTEFYASALQELLDLQSTEATAIVIDGLGAVAYSNADRRVLAAATVQPALLQVRQTRRTLPIELQLPRREAALRGYALPIPGTDWSLMYLRPGREGLAAANAAFRQSLVALVWVMGALTLVLLLVLSLSVRPLVRLSAATHKLGSGDLSFRLPPAEVEEFEPLVGAFNRMAGRLESAHEMLVDVNRGLEQRVDERTHALEHEHQKLIRAERLSTLGLISSAIAHDLRNPLNTISLGVYWLKMRLADTADERVRSRLLTIERELSRSDRIIKTLLAFARTGEPERGPVDVNELMDEVVEVIAPPPGVSVTTAPAPEVPVLSADRAQLFQVLENLVRNAIQAMPGGGRITLSSEVTHGTCRLSVADTGPGIPEDAQETVFEPLVTTKSTGTGLGLALCKRIIDAHGGRIWVESAPEQGAVFSIDLPLAEPPLPTTAPAVPGRDEPAEAAV